MPLSEVCSARVTSLLLLLLLIDIIELGIVYVNITSWDTKDQTKDKARSHIGSTGGDCVPE